MSHFLIDSHCHLNYLFSAQEFDKMQANLRAAEARGVKNFLCISVDVEHVPEVLAIAEHFPAVKASVGIHPCSVHETPEGGWDQVVQWAQHHEVLALGETGLDYYRPEGLDKTLQQRFFANHMHLSLETGKPVVIHTRAAREDTIALVRSEGQGRLGGVMHCFTESIEMAKQALDLGLYISFSGIITFKNAETLRDVVRYVPLDRMLVETDSPYLAPVPYRGKSNMPAYVVEVAQAVADLKGVTYQEVCQQTTENCRQLFSWPTA